MRAMLMRKDRNK